MDSAFCPQSLIKEDLTTKMPSNPAAIKQENGRDYKSMHDKNRPTAASLVLQQQPSINKTSKKIL